MNWITSFVRPKIQSLVRGRDIPDHFWKKCPSCEHMLFHKELEKNLLVCHNCSYHFRMGIKKRLDILFDNYTLQNVPNVVNDPIKFKDSKKYTERLKDYKNKTQNDDALIVAYGEILGKKAVVAALDFDFMGGSMGTYVGEAFIAASELAVKTNSSFLTITASGGARMQEGILSLMQMPKTVVGVLNVKEAKIPYITLLIDPTMGGVSASFAMLGDIAISEPGALIGFAGARVIKETIRKDLPKGFQKSEFLLEHGMIDKIVHRSKIKETVANIIGILKKY